MSRNYGETLAYWYLRLNGFIPISNYVLHRPFGLQGRGPRRSGDADILAVRFPYSYELVGGQPGYTSDNPPGDWDGKFRDLWQLELGAAIIGLIVQVKSGVVARRKVCEAFAPERVEYGLKRLGILDIAQYQVVAGQLCNERVLCGNQYHAHGRNVAGHHAPNGTSIYIGKLLISNEPLLSDSWFNLTLDDAFHYIVQHFKKYVVDKEPDRYYFPDDLIQFLAWRASAL